MSPARKPTPVRKSARSNNSRFIGLLAVVGVVGIAVIAWLATRNKTTGQAVATPAAGTVAARPFEMGRPDAPVTIVEFADFECPACGNFANITGPDVKKRLVETGQARLQFYPLPLNIHKNTWDASLAAACADDQGKFWEMHDRLFQGQYDWSGQATSNPRKVIRAYAQELGLDMGKYSACMEDERHRPRIQASYDYAVSMNVGSTPTFLIGGKMYPGSLPYDRIKALVDEAAKAPASGAPTDQATPTTVPATPAGGATSGAR
jgi:protein-disulfide isomerase